MSKARELAELSRTVSDSADAVAITIDASENVTFSNDITVTGALTLGSTAITATGTELNYVDGVTSAIQTQLNAKAPLAQPQFTDRVGIGVAAHSSDALTIASANQHIRLNNGSEIGIVALTSDGDLDFWAHGADEKINFRTGVGSGTVAMNVAGTNVLIGKTSDAFGTAGIALRGTVADFIRDGGTPINVNRLTDDGHLITLHQGSAVIGSLGSISGSMYIQGNPATGKSGLTFFGSYIEPRDNGAAADAAIDLGSSSNRFKDLHLSGIADASNFKISGAQGTDGQVLTSTGSGVAWEDASSGGGTAGIVSSANATAMTINSDEEIGIGLTNPGDFSSANANNLVVGGSGSTGMTLVMGETASDNARLDFRSTKLTGSYANLYSYIQVSSPFGNSPYDQMSFGVQDEEITRMVVSSGEKMLWGKTTTSVAVKGTVVRYGYEWTMTAQNGSMPLNVRSSNTNSYTFYVGADGQIYSNSSSIASISDERVKENIAPLETGLTQIMALRPRRFDFKKGESNEAKNVAGFIAQEVEPVLPDLVSNGRHETLTDFKALKMSDMIPTIVKAMQEQQALIESLTNRLRALEE